MSAFHVHEPGPWILTPCRPLLESTFLVPNGTFLVLAVLTVLALIVIGLVVGGLVWLLTSRRGATLDR